MEKQSRVWDREYGKRGTKWSRRKKDMPAELVGAVVLEAGVGNGKTLWNILDWEPKQVYAVDFSKKAIIRCREEHPGAILYNADITCLPFKDGSFDCVVMHYVLDGMLAVDRTNSVREAHRVLRPGGKVLFEDFAVGDFRQETGKRTDTPEENTLLKKKGLLCHYFSEAEVKMLFTGFSAGEISCKERRPIRNREHLVRKTLTAAFTR